MKVIHWKTEPILWAALIAPFVYLASLWDSLPERVPVHFNASGEPDRFGAPEEMIFPLALILFLPYLIMLAAPSIDPKGRIQQMGARYQQFKFVLCLSMAALGFLIVYAVGNPEANPSRFVFVVIGFMFAGLGNFMPSMKPNYFLGIRTPWTLENETVWRKTHRLSGWLWMGGGLLIAVLALFFSFDGFKPFLVTIFLIIIIVPLLLSYVWYRQEKNKAGS